MILSMPAAMMISGVQGLIITVVPGCRIGFHALYLQPCFAKVALQHSIFTYGFCLAGVYVQNLGSLVPPALIGCEVPADCALQVLPDAAAVGIPPTNMSPGTVLMTLQANCSCPFPLPQASGKPETTLYYARADSFSPQDQFSGIPTPVIAWNPKYGCQVLQHVTTPIQQVILCPVLHTSSRVGQDLLWSACDTEGFRQHVSCA